MVKRRRPDLPVVPRLWPGETVVCVGTGPSLTPEDLASCRGRAKVIVVNDAYTIAPWADALYACDGKWWIVHKGVPSFLGLKFGMTIPEGKYPDVQRVKSVIGSGLTKDPSGVMTGKHSGYQAINLAVHLGAARILLLGYDLQATNGKAHFFGDHPKPLAQTEPCRFREFLANYQTLVAPLKAIGVDVINCSRSTALTCFQRQTITEALRVPLEVAS